MSEYPALNPVAEAADTGLFGGLFEGEPLPSDGARDHQGPSPWAFGPCDPSVSPFDGL